MTVVLDASAALEIVFNGAKSTIYRQTLEKADLVLAPVLFDSEVTNVLWKYIKMGIVDEDNAIKSMLLLFQLIDDFIPTVELAVEALHEATRLNHPVYDMYYFVLARRNGAVLLTEDKKLQVLALDNGVRLNS